MFKKDTYIITLELQNYTDVCAKENYCFKVERDDYYLTMYKDLEKQSNGHSVLTFDKSKKLLDWRYATTKEAQHYELIGKPYDVTTLPEFVLPEKWCCNTTNDEEKETLNEFIKNNGYEGDVSHYYYIHYPLIGRGGSAYSKIQKDYTEITYSQFLKYVLNKEPINVETEDLTYLIKFLNNINIT